MLCGLVRISFFKEFYASSHIFIISSKVNFKFFSFFFHKTCSQDEFFAFVCMHFLRRLTDVCVISLLV